MSGSWDVQSLPKRLSTGQKDKDKTVNYNDWKTADDFVVYERFETDPTFKMTNVVTEGEAVFRIGCKTS